MFYFEAWSRSPIAFCSSARRTYSSRCIDSTRHARPSHQEPDSSFEKCADNFTASLRLLQSRSRQLLIFLCATAGRLEIGDRTFFRSDSPWDLFKARVDFVRRSGANSTLATVFRERCWNRFLLSRDEIRLGVSPTVCVGSFSVFPCKATATTT